jgi:U6 snRNA-associated Sm-like protein LSm4
MNMNLKDVICTSHDGTKFWKMDECHIRGYTVKYLRIPEEIIETIAEDTRSEYTI